MFVTTVCHTCGENCPLACTGVPCRRKPRSRNPHLHISTLSLGYASLQPQILWLLIPTMVFPILMHRSSCLCYDHGQFAGALATLNVMLTRLETGGVHVKCNKCFGLGCILTMWASGGETLFLIIHTHSK